MQARTARLCRPLHLADEQPTVVSATRDVQLHRLMITVYAFPPAKCLDSWQAPSRRVTLACLACHDLENPAHVAVQIWRDHGGPQRLGGLANQAAAVRKDERVPECERVIREVVPVRLLGRSLKVALAS